MEREISSIALLLRWPQQLGLDMVEGWSPDLTQSSHRMLGPSSASFKGVLAGAGSEVEPPGLNQCPYGMLAL